MKLPRELLLFALVAVALGPRSVAVADPAAVPPITPVSTIQASGTDRQIVAAQGQITELIFEPWKLYRFTDASGSIDLNFEDDISSKLIPLNRTLIVCGELDKEDGESEIEMWAIEEVQGVPLGIEPTTTADKVAGSGSKDQPVVLKGKITDLVDDPWNVYRFDDESGSVNVNLDDDIPGSIMPLDMTLLIVGETDSFFGTPEIDAGLIVLEAATSTPNPDLQGPTLQGLTLSVGALTPAFDRAVTSYSVSAPNAATTTTVTAIASGAATLTLNEASIESGRPSPPVSLDVGTNTLEIKVTSDAGSTTYTVRVTRASAEEPAPDPDLLTVARVKASGFDEQFVGVKGRIAELLNAGWNVYRFTDQTGSIALNFQDEIPKSVIPLNHTIIVYGELDKEDFDSEIEMWGFENADAMDLDIVPTTTVVAVSKGQFVGLKGKITQLIDDPWNIYRFDDGSGSINVNLEDDIPGDRVPLDLTLLVFGEVDESFGELEIDVDLIVVENGSAAPAGGDLLEGVPPVPAATKDNEAPCGEGKLIFYSSRSGTPYSIVRSYEQALRESGWTIVQSNPGNDPSGLNPSGGSVTATKGSRYLKLFAAGSLGQTTVNLCIWPSKPADESCCGG